MALVIYNPIAGDRTAKAFFDDHVLPLLHQHNIPIAQVLQTEREGHAGSTAFGHFEKADGPLDIIVGAGDGTLHEVLSSISFAPPASSKPSHKPTKVNIVLIPCGTANALYYSLFPYHGEETTSYKLKGINAYINRSQSKPIYLTLAITSIFSPPHSNRGHPDHAVAAVVTSTALHASILRDSEVLRAEIPGIDRFKVAARNNITKWYNSFVKLMPLQSSGCVEIYDLSLKAFVPYPAAQDEDPSPIVDLDGPFSYFLSTVNVDRLEPAFRISPLMSTHPVAGAFMDVIVVRPLRDPSLHLDSQEARLAFAEKSGAVLAAVYKDGDHINLRYDPEGKITLDGDGPVVVEYFRCGGWEWEPDDKDASTLCNDGFINTIPIGGKAICTAVAPDAEAGFVIYV